MNLLKRLTKLLSRSKCRRKLKQIKDKRFEEVVFTVIDLETSGLDASRDKILSFGAIKVVNGKIRVDQSLEFIFRQKKNTDNESVAIHGLLSRNISTGSRLYIILKKY